MIRGKIDPSYFGMTIQEDEYVKARYTRGRSLRR